jgi:hypothetical protein
MIMPDIPDFVSPIDGKVVNGRRGLREHNKRHNVTNAADFKNEWQKAREQRVSLLEGRDNSRSRKEAVIRAMQTLEQRGRR